MNNFLVHKNEECIKQNSADFYTMSIYSKDILNLDTLRLKEFSDFYNYRNNKKDFSRIIGDKNFNKFIFFSGFFISFGLICRFKSFLVIPLFFSGYYLIKRISLPSGYSADCENNCYFCQKNLNKKRRLENYGKYYSMINYIIDKNPNISSIDEFEREIDKSIKEYEF